MTLQTLEYFIAVARQGNFTRAAEECHVTQPALSRAIHSLEEELGCALLVRSGRRVTLTHEGEVCVAEAQRLLQQREELVLRVREAGRQNRRPLRVGYIIISALNTFMRWLGGETGRPPFDMETVYGSVEEVKAWLLAQEVDIILIPESCVADLSGVEWGCIQRSGLYAIVHKSNPLYHRDSLTMGELREQDFIMWDKRELPLLYADHIRACQEAGFSPNVVGMAVKMGDMVVQVAQHNAVGITNRSSSKGAAENCRFIPVSDSPERFGTVCVWRRENQAPQLACLREGLLQKGEQS